jgi:YbgC/YbaW family acyl-CoA thioester hydrolase
MQHPFPEINVIITVRFGDTDPYGVVYFASYFRYCHRGIEEFLNHCGLPPHEVFKNQAEGFGLPVVSAACDFLKPVWYGEMLRLEVSLSRMGEKSLTFTFNFYRIADSDLVARGHATIVAIGPQWQSISIPGRIRKAVEGAPEQ